MAKRLTSFKWRFVVPLSVLMLGLLFTLPLEQAQAASPTTITAYKEQVPVTINGTYIASQWTDTPLIREPTSGMTVAFKQNGTGLIFLMSWAHGTGDCSDQYCFGGIELGNLNNTGAMGTALTPTIMILGSPSFKAGYDEFISTADVTPSTVESTGYQTQSTCGTDYSGSTWFIDCYRPFKLTNASPYDPFPSLLGGSPIEIGFAVGEFNVPGEHVATDMSTYVLVSSSQTTTITTAQSLVSSTSISSTSTPSTTSTSSSSTVSSSSVKSTTSNLANYYAEELLVVVVGFSVVVLLVLRRYET